MAKVFPITVILILFAFAPFIADAANLSISPSAGTYEVGDNLTVRAVVSGDVSLNALSGSILFPIGFFSIQSVSKVTSILNFWVTEPTFSRGSGIVKFEGVTLGGFQGSTGTILSISLKAIKAGSATVSFQNGQVLANDGQGTDITGTLSGATFTIKEATKKEPAAEPIKKAPVTTPAPATTEGVVIQEEIQPAPSLNAPEIVRGSKYGEVSIVGVSDYPKAQVLVTFIAQDGSKVFITGQADADGGFTLVVPHSLKRGTYSVTAVMIKEDKTNSLTSNTITLEVGSIFSDLGWQIWLIILILILLILYLILRVYFHFDKHKDVSRALKRETDQAQKVTRKSFETLREDINDYEQEKLSPSERKAIYKIEKDINSAEKAIDKEIKDIESV